MRMLPSKYFRPGNPAVVKKRRAEVAHIQPPIDGMKDDAKAKETDPKFGGLIINMYPNDDRLDIRAGYRKSATMVGAQPVEHLVPYYGEPEKLAAATNHTLCDVTTGDLLKGGFTSNDWHWTAFSNLGDTEYTVMVNGHDGVWSWDGLTTPDSATVTITKIGKATSPDTNAVITVGSGDIGLFHDFDAVIIAGADSGHASANGPQNIVKVGTVPNTFELIGVDSSGWGSDQTTGTMTVVKQGSFTREAVKPPPGNSWLITDNLAIVVAHQNRLFFADESNLALYYLPLQQKYGELEVLPLDAIFKKGGHIKAVATWTVDGGMGMDDQIVVFTSNGECAIYSGVDPAEDFTLVGVYRLGTPQNKWCTINYGGELYVLTPTGPTPMSAVLKSGREGMEAADKNIVSHFLQQSHANYDRPGWELFMNPSTTRLFVNVPGGGNTYHQMIRSMTKPVWSEFKVTQARCWGWIEPYVYFGDDQGNTYLMHPSIQSDDGRPINIDVQTAWNQFKTPGLKHFKMILPYITTNGSPRPLIDVKVDFDQTPPVNQPDITGSDPQDAAWDLAEWDEAYWVGGNRAWANWTGVGALGRVACVRMQASVQDCTFSITGWDVIFERGSVFG